jgi:hypothetical protein
MTKRTPRGILSCAAIVGAALGACAHTSTTTEPAATRAVDATRGLCPTDLNQARAALEPRPEGFALVFATDDESQRVALHERVKAVGQALAGPHQAVNAGGELVQHPAVPTSPELREQPAPSPGYAVQLVIAAPEDQRAALKSELDDHLRLWLAGECPELRGSHLSASTGTTDPRQRGDR